VDVEILMEHFRIEKPVFDNGTARFTYALDDLRFTETLSFPPGWNDVAASDVFLKLLDLTALVLGVSYFKLKAPFEIAAPDLPLTEQERAFVLDVYENGLGEFYARNKLHRFGKLTLAALSDSRTPTAPQLSRRSLLPIGGGKDSLVSVALLEDAGADFTPFAVNPRGPILTSVERIGRPPIFVERRLDDEMIRLSSQTGYLTGHVPSTAINSMIAALCCLLYGYNQIVVSNERSASEGNAHWDGREVNHQYSKSLGFEERMADILAAATGGALGYYSLLRPYSEARITRLFARTTRFDDVFSSCNRNFRYNGHDGPLWCGECPKCHFVFLMLAPAVDKARLIGIFGKDLLSEMKNESSFRELTGLAGQKPWECVGEILEAAASLWELTTRPEWRDAPIVAALKPDLIAQYGEPKLRAALAELMADSPEHHIPADIAVRLNASFHAS
jgi:UDP-N-acetyl-alpha-D-muramoyl-L-alanyl-L-glutamate epimerase